LPGLLPEEDIIVLARIGAFFCLVFGLFFDEICSFIGELANDALCCDVSLKVSNKLELTLRTT